MFKITALVNAPSGCSEGIKEDIAMFLERFGDTHVISIEEEFPEQMTFSKPDRTAELSGYKKNNKR